MRRLKVLEHMSLDGVIQHATDEDFPYKEWFVPFMSEDGGRFVLDAQGEDFDLLLGRRTYDDWSVQWGRDGTGPFAEAFARCTKYVAAHRTDSLDWGPVVALGPDLAGDVRRLKGAGGPDLVVWGSSTLTSVLLEAGLVDELVLLIYPVLLGVGKRLFSPATPAQNLVLLTSATTTTGVTVNRYKQAGPVPTQR